MQPTKTQLRKHFRAQRAKVSTQLREQAAKSAAQLLSQQACFQMSQFVAAYLAVHEEFDVSPIIELIWQSKKDCFIPVLAETEKDLFFVQYEYGDPLHLNRYGILEPVKRNPTFPASELNLVITPLVAFDGQGHRLGAGGGYYDRAFAFLREENISAKPFLLGVGFAVQEANQLPIADWDIQLNGVLTEKKFISIP